MKEKPHRRRSRYGDYQNERGLGEVKEGIGRMNGESRRWKVNTQHNIQVIYYRIVHLKPLWYC